MEGPAPDRGSSGQPNLVRIGIRHGFDVPLRGAPEALIADGAPIRHVALCGADHVGLRPRLLVQPGDRVRAGQPLFFNRHDPAVKFTAPGSGTVTAVHRGPRRVLESVVVRLDADEPAAVPFGAGRGEDVDTIERADVVALLAESGLWPAFRARPFGHVPRTGSMPAAIFVTAIDTEPLAANPVTVVRTETRAFGAGLRVLTRLTGGVLWLCTAPGWDIEVPALPNLRRAEFQGPHPAGLAGTHVHHLAPVRSGGEAWHIGYQDVIAIGKLFADGVLDFGRIVALVGEPVRRPRLVRTRVGAALAELAAGELEGGEFCDLVSGSLLSGRRDPPERAFLGRYHAQVSALRARPRPRRTRWFWAGHAGAPVAAAAAERPSGMLPLEVFERLLGPGFLAVPLLRALMAGDVVRARELGCLELDEEDLALCAYLCPARCDYRGALRSALGRIEKEG